MWAFVAFRHIKFEKKITMGKKYFHVHCMNFYFTSFPQVVPMFDYYCNTFPQLETFTTNGNLYTEKWLPGNVMNKTTFHAWFTPCSYHQKVAYDPPILELKATYGLAAPEPFTAPALNPLWTKETYAKMNSKMAPKPENVSLSSAGLWISVKSHVNHRIMLFMM